FPEIHSFGLGSIAPILDGAPVSHHQPSNPPPPPRRVVCDRRPASWLCLRYVPSDKLPSRSTTATRPPQAVVSLIARGGRGSRSPETPRYRAKAHQVIHLLISRSSPLPDNPGCATPSSGRDLPIAAETIHALCRECLFPT